MTESTANLTQQTYLIIANLTLILYTASQNVFKKGKKHIFSCHTRQKREHKDR